MKVFTVKDQAVEAYMEPFFAKALGQAIRAFQDAVNAPGHDFNKHPEDYTLFSLGAWNEKTGMLETHEPRAIGNGSDFVRAYPANPDSTDSIPIPGILSPSVDNGKSTYQLED